jgi:DNA (cytosine-5)-methyltransferase 1
LAGKQKGMAKGENTRSGLLWEVERLLNECTELPQILLMENVTQVHGKKNIEHFNEWIAFLESKGYRNYWKDLNAKNFCVPQNRNRTFMVSVLGNYTYEFPQEFPLKKRLKDLLEREVDEKFYISNERVESIVNSTFAQEKTRIQKTNVCGTLLARDYKDPKCVEVEPLAYDEQNGYIRKDGTVGTLTTDRSSPKHNNRVIVFTNNQKGYAEAFEGDSINLEQPNSKTRRGRVGHGVAQTLNTAPQQAVVESCYVSEKGVRYICDPQRGMATDVNADICQPLTAKGQANWTGSFISPDIKSLERTSTTLGLKEPTKINLKDGSQITSDDNLSGLRIRKLTPKECFRLMAFSDEDFEKAVQVNSNAQLYKQAGNSIVVKVLEYIFLQMGIEKSWGNSFTETFSIRS